MPAKRKKATTIKGWHIAGFVRECQFDRKTVGKILANTKPIGKDSKGNLFSMRSFFDAWLSYNQSDRKNVEVERARLIFHQANIAELDENEKRGNLIPKDKIDQINDNVAAAVRRVIMSSKLNNHDKDSILAELKEMAKQDYCNG